MTGLHQSNMCQAKTTESCARGEAKRRGQQFVEKQPLYEILYNLNQGFEPVLDQLQQLEKLGLGHQPWKALRVSVEENRAEVNFELVERLAEREERDWTNLAWIRLRAGEASRSARRADRWRPLGRWNLLMMGRQNQPRQRQP